jgi:hypothetical protein
MLRYLYLVNLVIRVITKGVSHAYYYPQTFY